MADEFPVDMEWLGHACFVIREGGKTIIFDPFKINTAQKADIILITHEHYDHCSPADVEKVRKPGTVVIATRDCKLKGDVIEISPGEERTVDGVNIKAVAAYNLKKQYHPKENSWVGYIVTVGGHRIYHAGDTDLIPEMDSIRADIALLPVGGTYTMTAKEAAEAANKIKPKWAIPMHYGSIVGKKADADEFGSLCKCKVRIFN